MKKALSTIFLSFVLLCVFSCAEKIVSNKDASYKIKPKKIFMLVTYPKKGKDGGEDFIKEMQKQLALKNIQSAGYGHDDLSFDTEEDLDKKVDDYNPDAVMTARAVFTGNGYGTGNYNIALVDYKTKRSFWKSSFTLGLGSIIDDQSIEETVSALIKKLEQDSVI